MLCTLSTRRSEPSARFSWPDNRILFRAGERDVRSAALSLAPVNFLRSISAPEYKRPVSSGGSGEFSRGGVPSGLLYGVTVGEKFGPAGVFNALGVTALMPRSFSIDARPVLTEYVEHEFRRDNPWRGVDG